MEKQEFHRNFTELTNIPENRYHPLVWIEGEPEIGDNVYIEGISEIFEKGARVVIGDNCDIASFVSINCSDSHKRCIGLTEEIDKQDIIKIKHLGEEVKTSLHFLLAYGKLQVAAA